MTDTYDPNIHHQAIYELPPDPDTAGHYLVTVWEYDALVPHLTRFVMWLDAIGWARHQFDTDKRIEEIQVFDDRNVSQSQRFLRK